MLLGSLLAIKLKRMELLVENLCIRKSTIWQINIHWHRASKNIAERDKVKHYIFINDSNL